MSGSAADGAETVLEVFEPSGGGSPTALVARPSAAVRYAVVYGYGSGDEQEEGYDDLLEALDAADPDVVAGATVRWERADVAAALADAGAPDGEDAVDGLLGVCGSDLPAALQEAAAAAGWRELQDAVAVLVPGVRDGG